MSQSKITAWTSKADFRGTFADNMKAPIHRWFRYPAGFSYGLVEECFDKYKISKNNMVLDPFLGVGTTSVCAKKFAIASIGVEAHPLASWIAKVKTNWDFDLTVLKSEIEENLAKIEEVVKENNEIDITEKPKLLKKCFSEGKLKELLSIKDYILKIPKKQEDIRNLFILALLTILRKVSKVSTGWPYILPKKERKNTRPVFKSYENQMEIMISDLEATVTEQNKDTPAKIITGDARKLSTIIEKEIHFAFTSPPYLNNYDYADRTRLELYFLSPFEFEGKLTSFSTWKDLTEHVRSKLIVNASHQAVEIGLKEGLLPHPEIEESVREKLLKTSAKLRQEKKVHGGHKNYDIMVVAYFNDMFQTFKEIYELMKPNSYYLLVLGDSAPYGVHVPTDVYLAKIALGLEFSEAQVKVLRTRGGKWKSAPKHSVPLRESIVVLKK